MFPLTIPSTFFDDVFMEDSHPPTTFNFMAHNRNKAMCAFYLQLLNELMLLAEDCCGGFFLPVVSMVSAAAALMFFLFFVFCFPPPHVPWVIITLVAQQCAVYVGPPDGKLELSPGIILKATSGNDGWQASARRKACLLVARRATQTKVPSAGSLPAALVVEESWGGGSE